MESILSELVYTVNLYTHPPRVQLIPNPAVVRDGLYHLSDGLAPSVKLMLGNRKPKTIGEVSERIVRELLQGGTLLIDQESRTLSCETLRELADRTGLTWRPRHGIHCDDIATLATKENGQCILFLTESKGTTRRHGISADEEGKMFYQLARTFEKLRRSQVIGSTLILGGIISVIVNHHALRITANVNDHSTSFARDLPDGWMYPKTGVDDF